MLNLSQFNKSIIVYDEKVNDEVQIDISNILLIFLCLPSFSYAMITPPILKFPFLKTQNSRKSSG